MKNPTPVASVFSNRELVGGVKISWIFIPLFLLWIVFVVSLNIYMSVGTHPYDEMPGQPQGVNGLYGFAFSFRSGSKIRNQLWKALVLGF